MFDEELFHYGTPRHSGRYPYGSGENPHQHPYKANMDFLAKDQAYRKEGMSEKEIANAFGISINDYRQKKTVALAEEHEALVTRAQRLREHGLSYREIGVIMGGKDSPIGDTTVRGWCTRVEKSRKDKLTGVSDILEKKVKSGEILDVGVGSNLDLGVTSTTFNAALKMLKDKGYVVDTIDVPQPNSPNKNTTVKYLAPEGMTKREVWQNRDQIKTITDYTPDGGKTFIQLQPPEAISVDRVKIVYKEDGGEERDGMVGIRRNVPDISMGNSQYSQVRIAVDNGMYIKGMGIYDDNIPKGYDIVVYSNKSREKGIEGSLKKMKDDPENPFGANIKSGGQTYFKDPNGKFVKVGETYILDEKGKKEGDRYGLSVINKIKEEDDWANYRKVLPAQFLSKQSLQLITKQLDLTYKNTADEYETIMKLENPMVKKALLDEFAEGCDTTARHLTAAALPRQASKVIIPVPELGDNEIYAPTYKNGEKLALVRYPHAGTFEIPIVTVNNNNPEAKKLLKDTGDAVGINKHVADQLSGADFDGDTVVTIPCGDNVKIKSTKPLEGLKGFDPKEAYPGYEGMKPLKGRSKNIQMGIVTNLITDMSLQNATPEEMARAVRHSMVVIDAEKHNLNWKLSEERNCIEALKQKYQQNPEKKKGYGGSSTLLSRLGNATIKVPEEQIVNKEGKRSYKPDPETGEWLYAPTGRTKKVYKGLDKDGNKVFKEELVLEDVSPLRGVKDARTLSSGTPQEEAYAKHINKMMALANNARKESLAIKTPSKDPEAAKAYADEVESLNAKLEIAQKNKPLERQAQIRTSVKIENLKTTDPELFDGSKKDKLKKTKARLLAESRAEVGAGKQLINITDKEWEAIQAHAISGTKLRDILKNADTKRVKELATPRGARETVTSAKANRIKALSRSGFSIADIAEIVGVSTSTVSTVIK